MSKPSFTCFTGAASSRSSCCLSSCRLAATPPGRAACARRRQHSHPCVSSSFNSESAPTSRVAWALFELDGAVMDLHMAGHRVAFNKAFEDLGYECAQFTPPIYNDLLQSGDGTAEGLVKAYFDFMEWPQFVPTSERGLFTRKIVETKCTMLSRMLKRDQVLLRDGVAAVMDEARAAGTGIALIAGTQSDDADEVVDSVLRQLGEDAAADIKVFHCTTAPSEREEDVGDDADASIGLEDALRGAAAAEKAKSAAAFVATAQSDPSAPSSVAPIALDSTLLAGTQRRRRVTPELLVALAAGLGVAPKDMLLVASSCAVAEAGAAADLATAAVPRSMAFQGSFPPGTTKFEGYGVGNATWPRLAAVCARHASSS